MSELLANGGVGSALIDGLVHVVVAGIFVVFRPVLTVYAWLIATVVLADKIDVASAFVRMLIVVVGGLMLFKGLVFALRWRGKARVHLLFLLWPDMAVEPFMSDRSLAPPVPARVRGFLNGAMQLCAGTALLAVSLAYDGTPTGTSVVVRYVSGLVGASLVLHFGVLRIGAEALRRCGYPVDILFTSPLTSDSLRAFWGGRWNAAFSNLMRVLIVEPLGPKRVRWAAPMAFAASAVLHELAITWPIRQGYGGPTLYFVLQAVAHAVERRLPSRKWGRAFTLFIVAAPVNLLFPLAFVDEVILAAPRWLGALWS